LPVSPSAGDAVSASVSATRAADAKTTRAANPKAAPAAERSRAKRPVPQVAGAAPAKITSAKNPIPDPVVAKALAKARKTPNLTRSVRLDHASCFDFLPTVADRSVDLALIDPPYDVSRKTGFQSVKNGVPRLAVSMDFGEWDWGFEGLDRVIEQCHRALRRGGTIVVFYDLWKLTLLAQMLERVGFKQLRFVEWVKTNPVPLNSKTNYLTGAREIALTAVKGGCPTFNSQYDNGIYQFPICHEPGRFHPTQKPLALIRELVKKHSRPGDTVLDCFSGSATSAAAAVLEGRHFTGCELSADYHAQSVARLLALDQRKDWPTGAAIRWLGADGGPLAAPGASHGTLADASVASASLGAGGGGQ
jgi:site-specific DNA-methyltransferase (adenine-specific)